MSTNFKNNPSMQKALRPEGPVTIEMIWEKLTSHLSDPFESRKGISATCPFCYEASFQGKEIFLIFKKQTHFAGYNCFKCEERGGKSPSSLNYLLSKLGVSIPYLQVMRLCGEGEGDQEEEKSSHSRKNGIVEQISWPPKWVQGGEDISREGFAYLRSRGIANPEAAQDNIGFLFTKAINKSQPGYRELMLPWPSILIPMRNIDGATIGWRARLIDSSTFEKAPSYAKEDAMNGGNWRDNSLIGGDTIDPRRPLVVVEGFFDKLSSPNSVGMGGKVMSDGQARIIAKTGAKYIVLALDPSVKPKAIIEIKAKLSLKAPDAVVISVPWNFFGVTNQDPNDLGMANMRMIVRETVLAKIEARALRAVELVPRNEDEK